MLLMVPLVFVQKGGEAITADTPMVRKMLQLCERFMTQHLPCASSSIVVTLPTLLSLVDHHPHQACALHTHFYIPSYLALGEGQTMENSCERAELPDNFCGR
eukprot:TRINITY_DN2959_c0_g1_i1.p1 TRINITY_DN2959_c0_g1~~TRINITY_DN2959_c0_g1_i1.p1  ORF type:complete len:102 (+),score=1.81 TRINITY_DN2959_c0_g1_i1:491-796(+)